MKMKHRPYTCAPESVLLQEALYYTMAKGFFWYQKVQVKSFFWEVLPKFSVSGIIVLSKVLHLVTMGGLMMKQNFINHNSQENKLQLDFTAVLSFRIIYRHM